MIRYNKNSISITDTRPRKRLEFRKNLDNLELMITCGRAFTFLVTLYFSGAWAFADLPPESGELMQKLAQFTEEQSAVLQVRVMEKRLAVATVLEDLLDAEITKGNLAEANAINDSKGKLNSTEDSVSAIIKAHPKLPKSSRDYLGKLAEFEKDEKASLNQVVQKKNEAVAKALEFQFNSTMERGNLAGANAIKATIEQVRSNAENSESLDSPAPEMAADIPKDAIRHKGHHYKIFKSETPINWETAQDKCLKMGGELGWTPEEDSIKMLISLLQPFVNTHGHCCIWVGGHRNSNGEWEWLDGTKVDESIWQDDENSRLAESNTVMIRWIASFRASQATSTRPEGYLCRWE